MNWNAHKQSLLKDEAFKQEYDKLETKYKVAAELIRLRVSRGLTQEELARVLNTKQASIARIESGTYLPSLSMIKKIADVLNAEVELRLKPKIKARHPFLVSDK